MIELVIFNREPGAALELTAFKVGSTPVKLQAAPYKGGEAKR